MKTEHEFKKYLISEFRSEKTGMPYTLKVASDILSRCRRIEQILEIELSRAFISNEKNYLAFKNQIKTHVESFCSDANPYGYLQYNHALKAYYLFALRSAGKCSSSSKVNNDEV
jgi:hypothetical protein